MDVETPRLLITEKVLESLGFELVNPSGPTYLFALREPCFGVGMTTGPIICMYRDGGVWSLMCRDSSRNRVVTYVGELLIEIARIMFGYGIDQGVSEEKGRMKRILGLDLV